MRRIRIERRSDARTKLRHNPPPSPRVHVRIESREPVRVVTTSAPIVIEA